VVDPPPKEATMPQTTAKALTPKDVAEKFGTDSKTLHRFLRRTHADDAPGRGGRWEVDAKKLPALRKEFDAWLKSEAERKAAAAKAREERAAKDPAPEGQADEESDPERQPECEKDAVDRAQDKGCCPAARSPAPAAAARPARRSPPPPDLTAQALAPTRGGFGLSRS
jgi:hypothetical protein